ncbi:MAG: hypothetical protein ACE15E_01905 [Acidobacteriota bacterium]
MFNRRLLPGLCLVLLCVSSFLLLGDQTTVKYRYDAAGRVVEAQYGATARIVYQYDPMGNLLSRSVILSGSLLYLPFYQAGPSTFLGVAVANYSDSAANLEFRAFGENGALLPFPQNPYNVPLAARNQLARLGAQLFNVDSASNQAGWIQITSDNPQIGAFFESGNNALTQLDGAIGTPTQATRLYLTRACEGPTGFRGQGSATFVSIANPNDASIGLQLKLFGLQAPGGTQAVQLGATVNQTIAAKGVLYRNITDLFGVAVAQGYVRVDVTDGPGAVGFELIQCTGVPTLIGLNAGLGNENNELFSAQLASGVTLFTSLKLINTSAAARQITLRAIRDDGSALAPQVQLALGPGDFLERDAGEIFTFTDALAVGSLHVQADGPGVIGDVVFGEPGSLKYASSMPLQVQKFSTAVLNQVANGMGLFTGLALYNPGNEAANVTIEVYAPTGTMTGSTNFPLPAGGRLSQLVPQLVPETAGQVTGFIILRSTRPLIAQQLFGENGLSMLSAVPPSVVN